MRVALTIAGSDSSAGAGIQADLKTFAAHGVFGVSAVTAVTSQNTTGVMTSEAVPIGPKPSNSSTSMCCGPAVS